MNNDWGAYWAQSSNEVFRNTASSPQGLTDEEAQARRRSLKDGDIGRSQKSRWALLASQFKSPIVLLLFATAILSFMVDDVVNGFIVIVILGLSGGLGYWQESSAADAVAQLLKVIDSVVLVRRVGRIVHLPRNEVVPGDILLLKAGTVVAADCRVVEGNELQVDESALTGESFPVEKHSASVEPDAPLARRANCLFLGTHVVSGSGTAVVVRIGKQTEFGKISDRLGARATPTDFEAGLRRFGVLLVTITVLLVVTVFLANIAFQRPLIESMLFALALAVGMTPQLLPAVTSVVLANGAKLMARSEVIVKRLLVIENFGSMNTLCMDKTGTITSGSVELHGAFNLSNEEDADILRLAWLNASLQQGFENPIDSAINTAANLKRLTLESAACLAEVPYDFQRKRMSILVQCGSSRTLVTKGAFRSVLDVCTHAKLENTNCPISEVQATVESQFEAWSDRGFRVLAIATAECLKDSISAADEMGLTLVGLLAFADPLKPGIQQTLAGLRELGLDLKLVTGDNPVVAKALALHAGFAQVQVITGTHIKEMTSSELSEKVVAANIFAEVEPDQKEKIVAALQKAGRVVGFLGDGINDAPALHASDVGISVSTAVDVAKEAAQVVLLRPDLNVLLNGVREGRRTLNNTLKYIYFAISANFGYMLSMAIASLFLPFLPLLPSQILLINLLADFPAMALATDRVDAETTLRPRRWEMRSIVRFMLIFGLAGTCSDLVTFWTLLKVFHTTPELFRVGWFTLSTLTGLLILLVIRTPRPFWRSRPSGWLMAGVLAVSTVALYLPYSPVAALIELSPPTPMLYAAIAMICLAYVALLEGLKWMLRN